MMPHQFTVGGNSHADSPINFFSWRLSNGAFARCLPLNTLLNPDVCRLYRLPSLCIPWWCRSLRLEQQDFAYLFLESIRLDGKDFLARDRNNDFFPIPYGNILQTTQPYECIVMRLGIYCTGRNRILEPKGEGALMEDNSNPKGVTRERITKRANKHEGKVLAEILRVLTGTD